MAGKVLMQQIGDVMEKLFNKKQTQQEIDDAEAEKAKKAKMVDTPSPWTKATDLDAKMRKKEKDAGI